MLITPATARKMQAKPPPEQNDRGAASEPHCKGLAPARKSGASSIGIGKPPVSRLLVLVCLLDRQPPEFKLAFLGTPPEFKVHLKRARAQLKLFLLKPKLAVLYRRDALLHLLDLVERHR
jgi:hypothetical protein